VGGHRERERRDAGNGEVDGSTKKRVSGRPTFLDHHRPRLSSVTWRFLEGQLNI